MSEKQKKLLGFYEDILITAQHKTKPTGEVVIAMTKDEKQASVPFKVADGDGGKTRSELRDLVMPIEDLLRDPRDNDVFFHPLSEQITRGESEVFRYFKRAVILNINTTITNLGVALLNVQADAALQHKMTIEQIGVIKGIADADKSSQTAWMKMCLLPIKDTPHRPSAWGLNIHVKRNGTIDGKPFRRVGVVTLPLFERIFAGEKFENSEGDNLFRGKDYPMFRQVIEAIFPNAGKKDSFNMNVGYDGTFAPYLICFLQTVAGIAKRVNHITDVMENVFTEVGAKTDRLRIATPWVDYVSEDGVAILSDFARAVPALTGNMGVVAVDDGQETEEEEDDRPSEPVRRNDRERREEPPQPKETKEPEKAKETSTEFSNEGLNAEQIRLRDEAMARRKRFEEDKRMMEEERRLDRERRDRDRRDDRDRERDRRDRDDRDRDDRDRERDRRDRDRDYRDDRDRRDRHYDRDDRDYRDRRDRYYDRDRDDRDRGRDDRENLVNENGKLSFSAMLDRNPGLSRGTLTEEEERESRRGGRSYRGSDRRRRDDYDDYDDYDRGRRGGRSYRR